MITICHDQSNKYSHKNCICKCFKQIWKVKRHVYRVEDRLINYLLAQRLFTKWTMVFYPTQGGGSARDIFRGSGFIHKEHIMSQLTSIINFRHFHSFLASYSKIPTPCFYFEKFLPGPMDTLDPGRNHLK